jgi:MFS family permease
MQNSSPPNIRVTRLSVKAFFFISGFVFATWASRIPALQQRLQLNDAQLGSLLFALPAGLITSMPLAAWLLARYNSRNIMLAGVLLYATLLCCIGLTNSFWQAATVLFVFGAARNLFNISINTQSVGVQDLNRKSIIASFHGIWSLAGLTGAAFASLLIQFGMPPLAHFLVVACLVLLLVIIAWPTTLRGSAKAIERKPIFALPNKALLNLGIIAFFSMVCEGTMSDWSGVYFKKVVHAPEGLVTLGYICYLCFMTSGRFVGDWVANRIGARRVLLAGGILVACGATIISLLPNLISASVGFMFTGLGVSCIMPFVFVQASRNTQMPTGVAIAAVSTIGYLGFLTGPPLIGFLSQFLGLSHAFMLVAFLGLAITFTVYRIRFQQDQPAS